MIFPDLAGKSFGYINLNEYAKHAVGMSSKSIFLDPDVCQFSVDCIHKSLGIEWSYGGWMENRSSLWRGSYLDEGEKYIHLGVDFNAPVGTWVQASTLGHVIRIDDDHQEIHGWGKRIFIELEDGNVLIYAHLTNIQLKVGNSTHDGAFIGRIASSQENGGWYPHVHVQTITASWWCDIVKNHLEQLDRYGHSKDLPHLARVFPDPLQCVRLK